MHKKHVNSLQILTHLTLESLFREVSIYELSLSKELTVVASAIICQLCNLFAAGILDARFANIPIQ